MSKKSGQKSVTKRKRKKTLFLVCFFLVAVGLLFGLSLTVFFPVKNIIIEGESVYKAEDIAAASGISEEDNLFTLNSNDILVKIQQTLPFIKHIEIERKLPNTAVLKITDVDTYLRFENNEASFQTDDDYRIIPSGFDDAKFSLTVYCDWEKDAASNCIVLNNEEDSQIIETTVSFVKESGLNVNHIDLRKSEEIKMLVDNRFEVIFGGPYDFSGKFAQLVAMIQNIDEEKTGRIDLSDWTIENTKGYFVEAKV